MGKRLKYIICLLAGFLYGSCDRVEPTNLAPQVKAFPAEDITRDAATLKGGIILQGSGKVTRVRFLYGRDSSRLDRKVDLQPHRLDPQARIADLEAGTTYYYRLEAGNGLTFIPSRILEFTTVPKSKPVLSAMENIYAGMLSLILSCSITDDGGGEITACGFRYHEMGTGAAAGEQVAEGRLFHDKGMYCFTAELKDLNAGSVYGITAFAENSSGTGYSSKAEFATGNPSIRMKEAGTLPNLIGTGDLDKITELSIQGPLNGTDIRFLRTLCTRHCLTSLNLQEAGIVSGGEAYISGLETADRTISQKMFSGCSRLLRIGLPFNTVEIGPGAFEGCSSLLELSLPPDVQRVSHSSGCSSLTAIHAAMTNPHFKEVDGVLYKADLTELIWFPMAKDGEDMTFPQSLRTIGDNAFREYRRTGIRLPDQLEKIGNGAFAASALTGIALPQQTATLGAYVFENCKALKTVELGTGISYLSDGFLSGCPVTDLYIGAENFPPYCTSDAFSGMDSQNCTVHVPAGKIGIYRNSSIGQKFPKIIEQKR